MGTTKRVPGNSAMRELVSGQRAPKGNRLHMQMKTPPSVPSVVKHEDKTERLRAILSAHLLSPRHSDIPAAISVVARSAESPVARALVALGTEIAGRGITVRAIFGQLEPEKTPAGWTIAGPGIAFSRELRWAKNPRLADAHEQLVLGPETSWIGDCMRRDPSRRDAYEQFSLADAYTTSTLQTSFERLWAVSLPLVILTPNAVGAIRAASSAADPLPSLLQRDDNAGPIASSQH